MSDFNPFAPRHIGSALSVGGLLALMTAGPLRPDVLALSSACLLGSLTAFATHACFGGRARRPTKARRNPPPARPTPEWEDAESWEIPETRDARQSWDAARTLRAPPPRGEAVKGLHPALLMPVIPVHRPAPQAGAPEASEQAPRQALADLSGRRHSDGRR